MYLKFENKEDKILEKLESLVKRDQDFLNQVNEELKYNWDEKKVEEYQSKFEKICLENLTELKKIISEKGWNVIFKEDLVFNSAWLIAQHATMDIAWQKEFLSKLKENLNKLKNIKEANSKLALLEDRILIELGEPQEYGTQLKRDIKTGESSLYTIRDVNLDNNDSLRELDFRRNKVFLEPLEEYLKKFKAKV